MSWKKTYDDDYQESEFNMGFGTIDRLNTSLDRLNNFLTLKQYELAFKTLQVVYSEVYAFLKDNEIEAQDKIEVQLKKKLLDLYTVQNNRRVLIPNQELDQELRYWDRGLRKLLLKYKLYMKMQDSRLAAMKV